MTAEIRLATTPAEMLAVQRQRYAIYVRELGYRQRHADPTTETIAEPMDATGCIIGAFCGNSVVASVRVNYGDGSALAEYADLYGLHRFEPYSPAHLSIVTKLMIDPGYRAGTLMARFSVALYEYTARHKPGVLFCVIDCAPALRDFFLRIGYRQIGPAFQHPEADTVVPMAFAVYDLEHFKRIRSPLARVCPHHDALSVAWFRRTFAMELSRYA